jgi:integrase
VGKKGTSGGGTVRTRKDGLKEARLLVPKEYRAVVGRTYLYFYGKTEREAKDKRSAALSDLIQRGPRVFDARRITFGEWLERWIDSLPGNVAENTQGFYEHRARTYLKPTLGNIKLSELTAEHLDGLYRDLSRGKGTPSGRPLAASTVGQVHSTARVALGRAAKKGVITHNVARDADAPRVEKQERPTLGLDGLEAFFGAAAGERLEALWIVWCLTGLRPGEVYGLKWFDVRLPKDDSDGELLIRRSWSATRTGAVMRETTKTGKGRPVSLLPEATAAMSSHRTHYLEELVRYRDLWEEAWAKNPEYRDLVFPSRAGTPLDHGNVNRQQFKMLLRKAGLPPMRPYDIRHSFATLWVESGESAEVLQKVLGHYSITTTINTYSHLSPRYQRESFGRFGDALGGR